MKTTWNLNLLYKNLRDPAIERDQKTADKAVAAFAKKYRKNKKYLSDQKSLSKTLSDFEKLIELPGSKAGYYCFFRKDLDVGDKEAEALAARLEERGTKRSNQMLFFSLELGKLAKETQVKFLAAPELKPYRYWLKQLFENAKFDLSEPEEKILSLKSDVSFGRWIQGTENILNKKTVTFKNKQIPLPEAEGMIRSMPLKERAVYHRLYRNILDVYTDVADIAESEVNAVYTNKKIEDELRGYKTPYEATIRGYQNDVQSILALVDAVSKRADIAHRFYEIKRKLLNLPELTYADRGAQVGELKMSIPFEKAATIVRETFGELHGRYADIFDRLLVGGHVDVSPKKGKTGGAYCAGGVTVPTFVLLNHIDNFESLKTLAHEMGHAIHAERSKSQRPLYQGHPISTAETASTFFETAALNRLVDSLPEHEKVIALHDKIQDNVATVFRQIACFTFERDLHALVRKEGYVAKEAIADLMNKHMGSYLGKAVKLEREDGYFFVRWGHIRRFFYVYSYAYGQLISSALHHKLMGDASFIDKIDGFLAAGESKSPYEIFKACGLDTRRPDIFLEGLTEIERDVARLERLVE